MTRLSLRWMILLPLLASITVGFVAFALYIDDRDRSTRLDAIDNELVRAQGGARTPPSGGPPDGVPPSASDSTPTDVATTGVEPPIQLTLAPDGDVTGAQGNENPFSETTLVALGATRAPTTTDIGDYRVRASPQPDGQVLITALSLDGYHATTAALRRTLLVGALVIVLLESALAWWLASRLARPLATMAATANKIAAGALDTEIERAGGSREISDLSSDFEQMVARLRAALEEREQSAAVAVRARDDMQRFLADVSHEIRTPLTALKGYSDLYERGMLAEPGAVDRAMARVGSESVRLNDLVNSMLELARGDEPRAQAASDVDVTRVVRAVVDDLRAAYPERRIDVQIGQVTNPTVAGDPAGIHQAVLNLGANACAHTPASTPITISVESRHR